MRVEIESYTAAVEASPGVADVEIWSETAMLSDF